MAESTTKATVLLPLSHPPSTTPTTKSIFLAGTTKSTWRDALTTSISYLPVTIFNPFRPDWDASWREDLSDARFRDQVGWELEMQERADVVVVYFEAGTEGHVSLLELGLCVRDGRALVACEEGYKKRGNVQAVCERFGVTMVGGFEELREELIRRLES
ncbi:hypothetical protein CPLU01_11643 [Colletotrichum plurivorum]|uniref:Nucleoside 2-deoxyribosyltransferase n=1 Tax=Colletotrichum plurivorum TaxID=2175906 RepID=A0A8H6K152_9PEZI|nr:hypothetical protein CPLU01_11643 [Colletotrichum plurivorum]